MSRIGLSIDSSSDSCSSDLSDSEGSFSIWNKPREVAFPSPVLDRYHTRSLEEPPVELFGPVECLSSMSLSLLESSRSDDPPDTYRSRIRRRLEEMQYAAAEEQESLEQSTIQSAETTPASTSIRKGNIRFCLILCALTMVSLSVRDATTRPYLPTIRREEVAFPLHRQEQKRLKRELPKYYLPKIDTSRNQNSPESETLSTNSKIRPNMALARSQESRPVFGQTEVISSENRKVERFVLNDPKPYNPQPQTTSWTSWIAGCALICLLMETGYKEYRRCRIDTAFEAQRRL